MRILKLCVRFPPAPGGVEFQLLKILKELQNRGHNVEVYTSDLYSEIPWKKLDGPYSNFEGISVKRFKSYSMKGDMQYTIMPSLVRTVLKGNWDIIHAHSYGYFPSHVGAFTRRMNRGKFVFTPHFHPGETTWGGERRMVIRGLYDRFVAGSVIEASDKIICVSEGEKNIAINSGFDPKKIVIVPDSVEISRFDGLKEDTFKKKYGIEGDFILFVGRLAKNKGLKYLVEAVPQILQCFPKTIFVIIGQDEGMLESLLSLSKKLGVEEKIMFLGRLDDKEVSEAFMDCSVFALPSEFEAFGIVLIEAMAAGKPCVATKVGGVPYVVKDGETGILVDHADSCKLADAICIFLGDKGKRRSFGEAGRRWVEENFAIEKVVNRLEKVYEDVITGLS